MKKRILQFVGSFHQGGTERQAVALTSLLHSDGNYDIRVATLNKTGILLDEINSLGLKEIPEFSIDSFFSAKFVKQVRSCAAFLKSEGIDLVHCHDFYTNIFGMAACRVAGTKARVASKRETGGMRSTSQKQIERLAFGLSDAVVANSKAVARYLVENGVGKEKIEVIYNGLDTERFAGEKSSRWSGEEFGLASASGKRLITLVANLRHDVKNVEMFVRCAATLTESFADVDFVVAGEGELMQELRNAADAFGIGQRIHFIGRCTGVPKLLASSYACVLTSRAEGFSNSILEYMAAGKPVVATNVGGASEAVIEGETGYLVPSDDHGSMSECLKKLLSNEDLASKFGKAGRAVVFERFSQKQQLERTLSLYDRLINA